MQISNTFVAFQTIIKNDSYYNCVIDSPNTMEYCIFENCIFISHLNSRTIKNCSFKNCRYRNEDYHEAINDDIIDRLCEGDIIGYKKAYLRDKEYGFVSIIIIKLLIPAKAKRINGNSNKCRAEYAKVLGFYDSLEKPVSLKKGYGVYSTHDQTFRYIKGRIMRPHEFDNDKKVCTGGIHFFKTFGEAKNY
jgi:hypothetical protein